MSRSFVRGRYTDKRNQRKPDYRCRCSYCMSSHRYAPTIEEELKIEDYNMIQPESKLPWKYVDKGSEYDIIDYKGGNIINLSISGADYPPTTDDAKYIVIAANNYPILVDALERIESTTTDRDTAKKIRELLIEQGLWK